MQFERNLASSACNIKYSSHVGLSKELLTAKMAFPIIYEFETMVLRQIFKKYSDNDILRSKINGSLVNFEADIHEKSLVNKIAKWAKDGLISQQEFFNALSS